MRRLPLAAALSVLASFVGCSGTTTSASSSDAAASGGDAGGTDVDAGGAGDATSGDDGGGSGGTRLRILAGNLSSGSRSSWDGGEGIRLVKAMHPDVALLQETNYGTNGASDVRAFIDAVFDASAVFAREDTSSGGLPNAVVSRFPIVASGSWTDALVTNRSFVWAHVDLPGQHDLWAVSVHLLTTSGTDRGQEATQLAGYVKANVPAGDYVAIGGDFNTDARNEPALGNLSSVVATGSPYPADQQGNDNTNAPRSHPYDWVVVSPSLASHEVPLVVGATSMPHGLVFDTRVYTPIADVPPALATDSAASGMQHMAVVREFLAP